jgi:major vault protein
VETNDHATLVMHMCYSAYFDVTEEIKNSNPNKLFSISDYIGIACKSIASRIRGAVSYISYEEFHHKYSTIIKNAVFPKEKMYRI